ncbi:DUF4209 domain-containing protein [Thermodesulfobacteriota bacterium]
MERFPDHIKATLNDFKKCGWLETIEEARREDYSSMWQALSAAARQAMEKKQLSEAKVLWLLADACSMMLRPSSMNEPFKPCMVMDGKRSALPEDFKEEDVAFFKKIITEITDPKLCARISDIIWLLEKPRDPKFAVSAIDNYRQIPLDTDSWIRDGGECWERAVQLCIILKDGAGDKLKEIEKKIVESLKATTFGDGYLALWLSELLIKYRIGRDDQTEISQKLEALAINFNDEGDIRRSRDYFEAAEDWYRKIGKTEKIIEMTVQSAEGWVKEAIARQTSDPPSHLAATGFYEKSIQKYRTIPKKLRGEHDVDKRITELRNKLNEAGENSLGEMSEIRSEPIDITELIERATKLVRGKGTSDALLALANVYRGANVDRIRKFSEEMLKKHPLQGLVSATHMSEDGRVIAKRPGTNFNGDEMEATVWPEMVKHYMMELSIVVQGDIWPALEVIRQEHRLKEVDFFRIVRQSPIVPVDRQQLVAKALFSGYDNDFVTALHLLVPQMENIVRFHLKQAGVKTTNLDINGIENEIGLSSLMEHEEANEIFGRNLAFEIKALLCDPIGPNLRNELAHGLIDYNESQSIYSIYAWWIGLRIVFNTYWKAKQLFKAKTDPSEQDGKE